MFKNPAPDLFSQIYRAWIGYDDEGDLVTGQLDLICDSHGVSQDWFLSELKRRCDFSPAE